MQEKFKGLFIGCLGFMLGAVTSSTHYYQIEDLKPHTTTVCETYTVKPGDTFWKISEEYRARDCRNPYILEYKYELEKINPQIRAGEIHTGDKIFIKYYIKEE